MNSIEISEYKERKPENGRQTKLRKQYQVKMSNYEIKGHKRLQKRMTKENINQ